MNPIAIAFGVATAVVVALGFLSLRRDRGVAAAASVVLALGWIACRVSEVTAGWGYSPDAYALTDLISCILMVLLYGRSERKWVIGLALIFATQSALHFVYQAEGRKPGGIYPYLLMLDILYALALCAVAYGGRRAFDVLGDIGRWMLYRMRDHFGPGRPQGAGARHFSETTRAAGRDERLGRSLSEAGPRIRLSKSRAHRRGA